ncbi:MAG: hypothetical protein ACYTGX_08790 [Planctomycetota bacterium]|jgi:hypothetical protein
MRRASIAVLLLTFLALVAGTLAVPARSSGLVWTISPVVTQTVTPSPSSASASATPDFEVEIDERAMGEPFPPEKLVDPQPKIQLSQVVAAQTQGTVALGLGQPDLHWQPLWKALWPESDLMESPESPFSSSASTPATLALSTSEDWTVDTKAWALQLGLILALGGLLVLALRIIAARREANRDLIALAAR